MISKQAKLEKIATEFLHVLETDRNNLERTISILDQLRAAMIRRDEKCLEQLLGSAEQEQAGRVEYDQLRNGLRAAAARLLQCRSEEVTLTKLIAHLAEPEKTYLTLKKQELEAILTKLRSEYIGTVSLLGEFSRLNKLMLNAIISSRAKMNPMYNSSGTAQQQDRSGLVNIQF